MQGVEGQIFGPMARTYAYALLGAVIATFTVTPVMSSLLLPDKVAEVETFLVRKMREVYQPLLTLAVRNARLAAMIAVAFLVICGGLGMRLGTEFLPKLEEGNLWIRALLPPTITLDAGRDTVDKIRNMIVSYAPVRTVVSEQGRGEDATDPDGSFVAEFFVPLKPFEEWPEGLTKPKLVKEMAARLEGEFIGIDFNFSQYIQDNIEEAVSGVKGENSVKIFGRDLHELERLSKAVKDELTKVPGIQDPGAFQLLGQPNLVIEVDRAKAARYGITVSDMNTVVQAAIGGQEVTRIYEGEMNFPRSNTAIISTPSARCRWPCRIPIRSRRPPISRSATSPRCGWRPAPPISTGKIPNASCRSNTACAAATSARPWARRRSASPRTSC
jgi:cobalt-zinc-cadmium resistance protein CzcA